MSKRFCTAVIPAWTTLWRLLIWRPRKSARWWVLPAPTGMSYVGDVFRNTKEVLRLCGKPEIPIVMGSETPLSGEHIDFSGGSKFHGMSGIGGVLPAQHPRRLGRREAGGCHGFYY